MMCSVMLMDRCCQLIIWSCYINGQIPCQSFVICVFLSRLTTGTKNNFIVYFCGTQCRWCRATDMAIWALLMNMKNIYHFSFVSFIFRFCYFVISNFCSVPQVLPLRHVHTLHRHHSTVLHHQELQLSCLLQQWLCQLMLLRQLISLLHLLHKIKITDSVKVSYSCTHSLMKFVTSEELMWKLMAEI